MSPLPVTALVLCGGASRRMGRDKALVELDGTTLLERVLTAVDPIASECLLACGPAPRYAELGRRLVLDEVEDGGPLAGLAAGLAAASTEWVLAVACDMPRLAPDSFDPLLHAVSAHPADRGGVVAPGGGGDLAPIEVDLCVFEDEHGPQPLCALYRRAVLPAVRAALAAGERRMISFWDYPEVEQSPGGSKRVPRVRRVPAPGRAGTPGPEPHDPLRNVNTPQDLARERERWSGR